MSLKQLVFLIAVAAVVFGVTFVKLYLPSQSTGEVGKQLPSLPTAKLRFPLTEAYWGKKPPGEAPEFELKKPGSYTFWFENPNDAPVQLGVSNVTCKCSHVDVCLWPPDWKANLVPTAGALATLAPLGPLDLFGGLAGAQPVLYKWPPDASAEWKSLTNDPSAPKASRELTVPPGAAGWIRISWNTNPSRLNETLGPTMLAAEMWTQSADSGARTQLAVPLVFVTPLRMMEQAISVGQLGPYPDRPRAETSFLVWSSTRPQFALRAAPSTDPCVTVAEPVPLRPEEIRQLAVGPMGRLLAGYRVTITVQEQAEGGAQLDIGLFNRQIKLISDPDLPEQALLVSGTVRGEVSIVSGQYKDYMALGSFKSRFGTDGTAVVTADRSDLQLEVVKELTPDFLEARLEEVKSSVGKAWALSVKVLPGRVEGELKGQAVYLKTNSTPPRRIRIPVTGNAYN